MKKTKLVTKRGIIIAIATVFFIIISLILYVIKSGDVRNIISSIENELIKNQKMYNSINKWIDFQFNNEQDEHYPFIIKRDRVEHICRIVGGNYNHARIKNSTFSRKLYNFFDKESSIKTIIVYKDRIIYRLFYGTTTMVNKSLYRIKYSLVYFREEKPKEYKNYKIYKKGAIPETKIKWLYYLDDNWYITSH